MMISSLRMLLAAFIVFILQVTVVHRIALAGARPDLVLALLVVLVIDRKPLAGILIGFSLGFLQDLGNASLLGMNALAKSLVGYGIARFGGDYLPDNALFRGLLVFAASLACDVVVLNISSSFDPSFVLYSFFRYSILSAVYTAALTVILVQVLRLVPRKAVRRSAGY